MNSLNALKILQDLTACLNGNYARKYFLIDGTLLGHTRNGGFIAGDYDIDIGMWIEDFDEGLIADMQAAGFALVKTYGTQAAGFQLKFRHGDIPVDIVFYYHEPEYIWNTVYAPLGGFKATFPLFDLAPVNFQGLVVMAPDPPEKYLSASYGPDWRRPVARWNYKYCTHNMVPQGGRIWKTWYRVQRAWWQYKNPDVSLPKDRARDKVIYTDGVFDLFHANHALMLQEARAQGDRLVVGVVSDRFAASYKRPPYIPEAERLRIIQSLACVDAAFLQDGPMTSKTLEDVVAQYGVDLVVYAGDSMDGFGTYFQGVIDAGMFLHMPYHDGVSTSRTIADIVRRS